MRVLLAALLVCAIVAPALAQKQPKVLLLQTYVMPGQIPDIQKKALPKNSKEECWEAAKAFDDKGVPEELKGVAVGVWAGCMVPDHIEPSDDDM